VALCLLFRNPEFGHEPGPMFAEGSVASGGPGTVIAAIVGRCPFERASIAIRAVPPMSRTATVANVIEDPSNTNSPNTRSHTGMIAVRLNDIDMVLLLSCRGLRTTRSPAAVAVATRQPRCRFQSRRKEAGFS